MQVIINPTEVALEYNGLDELGRPLAVAKDSTGKPLATFLMSFTAYDMTLSLLCFGRSYSITIDKSSPLTIEYTVENLLNHVNMTSQPFLQKLNRD